MGSAAENLDSRTYILRAAYHEIHRKGYRAASLRDILARAGLSKGALYHHFSSKRALGYAVVEELITPYIRRRWVAPLMAAPDPVAALISLLEQASSRLTPEDILHGCALNNLAQEMSPIDAGFRIRLNRVFTMWRDGIAEALQRGQAAGCVRGDVDTHTRREHRQQRRGAAGE